MENYKSNGAFIDDLYKALEETKPSTPYGWHHTIEIDGWGHVVYNLRSTATDRSQRAMAMLGTLMPADYEYTRRGVEYHWHKFQMDLWKDGTLSEPPPVLDLNF